MSQVTLTDDNTGAVLGELTREPDGGIYIQVAAAVVTVEVESITKGLIEEARHQGII